MNDTILTGVLAIITALLTYFVKVFVSFINAKTKALSLEFEVSDKAIAKIGLDTAQTTINIVAEAVVGMLEENFAKELREKIKNGTANKTELYALANSAYIKIIEIVKPEIIEELSKGLQDVEGYIRDQIENQLHLLKLKENQAGGLTIFDPTV